MSTPFAAIAAQLGQVTTAVLSDAVATFGTEAVAGIFDDSRATAQVGNIGMATRVPFFTCDTVDLPAGAEIGRHVSIGGVLYTIADRDDLSQLGQTVLELERAS